MICGRSIRTLTPEERDRRQELARENYERVYAEIEAELMEEWDREFGPEFRAKHPFKPDTARVHQLATARIAQQSNDEF